MRPESAPVVSDHPVVLRPLDPSDAKAWFEFAGDPRVLQYTSTNVQALEDLLPIIERANSTEPGSPIQFAVCSRDDNTLIGVAGFHTISPLNRTAEITYTLRPSHWGRGIATAVCAALAAWGFEDQKFVRIQATVLEPNVASIRLLQRCGFEFEGKLRNFRMVRGEPRDYLLYALAKPPASAIPGPKQPDAAELHATVARMESRLPGSPAPAVLELWRLYQQLVPRFEADLQASARDVALAKASALMLVQAVAQSQSDASQGLP